MTRRRSSSFLAVAAVVTLALVSPVGRAATDPWVGVAKTWNQRVRNAVPENRYEMAGGCYAIRGSNGYFQQSGNGFAATAVSKTSGEPFYFKATALGSYLLYGKHKEFVAASEGVAGTAAYSATGSVPGRDVGGVTYQNSDAVADSVARSDVNAA
ncbi:MAG: hypothetical protein NVSMB57_14890 [Actinomycetota bacterium]